MISIAENQPIQFLVNGEEQDVSQSSIVEVIAPSVFMEIEKKVGVKVPQHTGPGEVSTMHRYQVKPVFH
jgi:hypothetical protein